MSSGIVGKCFPTVNELRQYLMLVLKNNNGFVEVYSQKHAIMLACSNYKNSSCDANIVGIYNIQNQYYEIRRCELIHKCELKSKSKIEEYEIKKEKYKNMRCGKIVEEFAAKGMFIGYSRAYALIKEINSIFENPKEIVPLENKENKGNLGKRQNRLFDDCLRMFEHELRDLNPGLFTKRGNSEFFLKHSDYQFYLREIVEIKIYKRESGYLIIGFMFDSNNEPVVQSLLITTKKKENAISSFLKYNAEEISQRGNRVDKPVPKDKTNRIRDSYNGRFVSTKNDAKLEVKIRNEFYLVELDMTLINVLKSQGINFFVKTRSVIGYLENYTDESPLTLQHFYNCNYGTKEYLKLEPKYYLAKEANHSLFGLYNLPPTDPEFISETLLSQPFFICLNSLLCALKNDMKTRQNHFKNAFDSILPNWLNDIMEEYVAHNSTNPTDCCEKITYSELLNSLSSCQCECGKYQEYLFPCIHIVKKVKEYGFEPYYFVSSVYSKNKIAKLKYVQPVADVNWVVN